MTILGPWHGSNKMQLPKLGREEPKLSHVSSLAELRRERFVPFILAPVYIYGKVPFNIIERFFMETSIEVFTTIFDFQGFDLIDLPESRSQLLIMDDMAYPYFCRWLETVELVNPTEKTFAIPRRLTAPILDPFTRMLGVAKPPPELVDVWCLSSVTHQLVPATHVETVPFPIFKKNEAEELTRKEFLHRLPKPLTAPDSIKLLRRPPDPGVVIRGTARLKEIGVSKCRSRSSRPRRSKQAT